MAGVNFVGDGEVVFNVDLGVFSDVADGRKNAKIFAEVFFDGFGFGGRLDDD